MFDHIGVSCVRALVAGGVAALLSVPLFFPGSARADFGIASFTVAATNQDGSANLLAGSHPFAYTFEFGSNSDAEGNPEGELKGLDVDLPPGLLGNPLAVPRCSRADFDSGTSHCQSGSQVGVIEVVANGLGGRVIAPVFNLVPPPGYAASFGLSVQGKTAIEGLSLEGSGSGAHLRVTALSLPAALGIRQVTQTVWGVPADPGHDGQRGACLEAGGTCPAETAPAPLLTLPVSCGVPLVTTLSVRSVEEPGRTVTAVARDPGGEPPQMVGCGGLRFAPDFALGTGGTAHSPTPLQVDLTLPTEEQAYGRNAPTLDRLTVRLPPGLALNPSAAAGLVGCGMDETQCPEASKLGTATAELPSIDHRLKGGIFLAASGRNPFGSLFALYVVLEDSATGVRIRLPARLDADPNDGAITVTVDEMPQLPFGHVQLEFAGGPGGLLVTPPACGRFVATGEALPSNAPGGAAAPLSSAFTLDRGVGGPCPPSPLPDEPSLEAGGVEPLAGLATPFLLRLWRSEVSQQLSSFDVTLPPGVSASVAGVGVCADTEAPACPASSEVGSATIAAGGGSSPLHLPGTAYLAGPYRGAPFSLLVVVPALAGPFDLGTVAVRAGVRVNATTGQLTVASDPFPQILEGVPLNLRSVSLTLDRSGFIRNPTNCEPMSIGAAVSSTLGHVIELSNPFQVGDCAALDFEPRLSVRLLGPSMRGAHPSLRAVLRPRSGDANLRRLTLALPDGALLDSRHIRDVCSLRDYAAKACPAGSAYGSATVWSPLLDRPLTGPVYLRSSSGRLPDLVASLGGEVHLDLAAHLGSRRGRIQIGFGSVPDLPLSKVSIRLAGGRQGLLALTGSLCRHRGVRVGMTGQNGRLRKESIRLRARCHEHADRQ